MSATVVGVTPSQTGQLTAGQSITIRVTMSGAVSVVGVPTLTLNDGGTATYDLFATSLLNDPTQLVFDYTVGAGDSNVAELAITGGSPNGAIILDATGNVPDFTGLFTTYAALASVAVSTPLKATSVSSSAAGTVLAVGETVTITVSMTKAVTVTGGTPTLALNDGGTAIYDAAATAALGDPTRLMFDYTVGAADAQLRHLDFVGGSPGGATIAGPDGQAPDFSLLFDNPQYVATALNLSTTSELVSPKASAPTFTAVDGSALVGPLAPGQSIHIDVGLQNAVTVSGGTPTLLLNDGGTATYDATASTATNLVFDYTVSAADHNVSQLTVVSSSLGGAVIVDSAGLGPDFSNLLLGSGPAVVVHAPAVVTGVTPSTTGALTTGQSITLTISMSSAVTVTGGTPTITLNDGGTSYYSGKAYYDAAKTAALGDPTKLVFDYTVLPSDIRADQLAIIGGSPGNATITDSNGNVPDFSALFSTYAILPGLSVYEPATVTGVAFSQLQGILWTGQSISVTVFMSSPVAVSGTPTLQLNDGGIATYDAAATAALGNPAALVFDYTVSPSDQGVNSLRVTGIGGGTVADSFGKSPNFSGLAVLSQYAGQLAVSNGSHITLLSSNFTYGPYDSLSYSIPNDPIVDANGNILFTSSGTLYELARTPTGYATSPTAVESWIPPYLPGGTGGPDDGVVADAAGNLFGLGSGFFEIARTATGYASTPTMIATAPSETAGDLLVDSNGDLFGVTTVGDIYELARTATGYSTSAVQIASFYGAVPTPATLAFGLVADASGDLFGVSLAGGSNNDGFVFEVVKTAAGYSPVPVTLASFSGGSPYAPLLIDANGDLFGTTASGGAYGNGTVFELANTPSGYATAMTTLASFNFTDGAIPASNLIADANGDLFGTTYSGGPGGDGTVFEIARTATGYASTPTILSWFDGGNGNGPVSLAAGPNGDLIGRTTGGGYTTVFDVANTGFFVTQSAVSTAAAASQPAGIDLSSVGFGADTTLAYAANSADSGGTLSVSDGTHAATIALIGQYAAADFSLSSDGAGGTLVSDPHLTGAALTAFLASPHT
ncbi:MAG: hypothetical protein P4M07_09210 [Xanthobacteraceae bacterium]|nr:hypothetical protein [Xanthobacteraceae bacterium]